MHSNVLLVEDNEVNRMVAAAIFEHHAIKFVTAINGSDAFEKWQSQSFDLILMDCQMPVMDGYEATQKIRQNESAKNHIPIIALTASATQGDRDKCLRAGMDDYLSKPFDESALMQIVNKWAHTNSGENQAKEQKPMNPALSVLDESVLESLSAFLSQEKIAHLLQRYLEDSTRIIQQLGDACGQKNADEARRLAHSLKSTSANVGALAISSLAKELEEFGRNGNLPEIRSRMDALKNEFKQARQQIEDLAVMTQLKQSSA